MSDLYDKLKVICNNLGGYEGSSTEEIDEAIAQIKQVFAEEHPLLRLDTTSGNIDNVMTGQEFYEQFVKAFEEMRDNGITEVTEVHIVEAAKKAAGIE